MPDAIYTAGSSSEQQRGQGLHINF